MRSEPPKQPPTSSGYVQVGRLQLIYQDATCSLWIGERKLPLSPTEYRLCATFLHQASMAAPPREPQTSGSLVLAWVEQHTLLSLVQGQHRYRALSRQISTLNSKLLLYGLHVVAFEHSYALVLTSAPSEGCVSITLAASARSYEAAQAPGAMGDMDTEAWREYGSHLLHWIAEF